MTYKFPERTSYIEHTYNWQNTAAIIYAEHGASQMYDTLPVFWRRNPREILLKSKNLKSETNNHHTKGFDLRGLEPGSHLG